MMAIGYEEEVKVTDYRIGSGRLHAQRRRTRCRQLARGNISGKHKFWPTGSLSELPHGCQLFVCCCGRFGKFEQRRRQIRPRSTQEGGIGRHENSVAHLLEGFQCCGALRLRTVTVNHRRLNSLAVQLASNSL